MEAYTTQSKEMSKLFVTAPHSFCNPENANRHCDRVALAAVNEIRAYDASKESKTLASRGRLISDPITSDKLRTLRHDYNRPNTDKTQWRENLRNRVKQEKPDFVLEIHSFPGNHEMYQRLWHGADLAIFASDHNKSWIDTLVSKINSHIAKECGPAAKYRIEVVKPWHAVAITDDMVAIRESSPGCGGLMHSLFEFNEDMPSERIPVLARAVYEAVVELIEQNRRLVSGGVVGVSDLSGFDTAITHPASLYGRAAMSKNMCELKMLLAVFLLLSLILIGLGRAIIGRAYDAAFPQLRGWVPYEIG